jgi:hypothetical protein
MVLCSLRFRWRRSLAAGSLLAAVPLGCGDAPESAANGPTVIRTIPSNGENDVDSELAVLSVTFSEAMGEGWSWVTETGHAAPEVRGFAFYIDEVTNVLPVRLAPHTNYAIWVNSPDHAELRKFANPYGVSAHAYRMQFETR